MQILTLLKERDERKWIILSVVLIIFSLIIKYFADGWTIALLNKGAASFLSTIIGGTAFDSFDFYVGRVYEVIWGPLEMLCSGIAFLLISLRYFKDASSFKFCFSVFVYLLITKFEILFFPPYGDSASGPVIEAIWLFRNNFDYVSLSKEVIFVHGGPKAYLFSIYPTYLALLMKLIPNTKLFLAINHLIIFGLSAVVFSLFRRIVQKVFSRVEAIWLTVFFLSLPLVQSQIEQINMEIPVLLFLMFSLCFIANKKIFMAAITSGLATFTKLYSVYAGVSVFMLGILLFFLDKDKKGKVKVLLSGFLSLLLSCLGAYALFTFMDIGGRVDKVGPFQGFALIKMFPVTYFYLISLIGIGVIECSRRARESGTVIDKIKDFLNQHYIILVSFIYSTGWFVLFLNSAWIPPRYVLILLPTLIIGVFYFIRLIIQQEKIIKNALFVLISFSFLCSYGLPYTPIDLQDHSVVERSLEYRNDVRLHMKIGKLIDKKYANLTIAAPFTLAQMFAFPEMGFVEKKHDVMIYLFPCTYGGIKNFDGIDKLDLRKVIWVGARTPLISNVNLPAGPHDVVLQEIVQGNKSAKIFLGGFSINAVYRQGQAFVKFLESKGIHQKELKEY